MSGGQCCGSTGGEGGACWYETPVGPWSLEEPPGEHQPRLALLRLGSFREGMKLLLIHSE